MVHYRYIQSVYLAVIFTASIVLLCLGTETTALKHSIPLRDDSNNFLYGNISIGTPAKNFTVGFVFHKCGLWVVGKNVTGVELTKGNKHRYDPSDSSTSQTDGRPFSDFFIKGYLAKDVVNLGGIQNEMTFGVTDNFTFPEGTVFDGTVDGFVGLSNDDVVCDTYLPPVFKQIEASLHRPMFSLHTNRDFALNGTVTLFDTAVPIVDVEGTDVITIGDEDTENCLDDWRYVPRNDQPFPNSWNQVHLTKLSYKTETPIPKQSVISLNTSLVFEDISLGIFTSNEAVRDIFVEASGAFFNSTLNLYEAECQRAYSKDAAVWLRIGENGTEMELGLWWRDYIRTEYIPEPSLGSDGEIMRCFLDVYLLPNENRKNNADYLLVGQRVLNNHCVAFNFKKNLVGFASAKWKPRKKHGGSDTGSTVSPSESSTEVSGAAPEVVTLFSVYLFWVVAYFVAM